MLSDTHHDGELAATYARDGSEAAFRALVSRHVDLVFATALRQVGDRGMAEEITQNVFVALARKAPRLTGFETLAGWLHQAAIHEAKVRVRAELRRRHRECVAGELAALRTEGATVAEALVPLLDEALLNLRERDRLVLILRFMEDRSLREVGGLLGVEEDAARKRVNRALERVAAFFRQRGFALPGGTVAGFAGVATQGASAAPAGLAAAAATAGLATGGAATAGLATGGAATGLSAITAYFMAMTKTQTAALCAVLALGPLVWQRQARSETREAAIRLETAVATERAALGKLGQESDRLQRALLRAEAETLTTRSRRNELAANRSRPPTAGYRWDDNSPVVRFPKGLLEHLSLTTAGDKQGHLTPQIKEALQLNPDEMTQIEAALGRFLAGCHAAEAAVIRPVTPTPADLFGHRMEDTRVFELTELKDEIARLRTALLEELRSLLDGPRAELLVRGLGDWIPMDDADHGLNSSLAVFDMAHRLRFYRTPDQPQEEPYLDWGLTEANGSSMNVPIRLADIPEHLQPHLQDWINEARKTFLEGRQRANPAPAKP